MWGLSPWKCPQKDVVLDLTLHSVLMNEKPANKNNYANPYVYSYAHCALVSESDLNRYTFYCLRNLSLSM